MSSDEAFVVELVAALNEVGLDYVIVGNMASVLHGAPITTQDVDVLIRNTPLNRKKLKRLAEELGCSETSIDMSDVRRLIGNAVPVDIMFDRLKGGFGFSSLKARSEMISVGNREARVASLEDVVKAKRAANRKKDRAVLPILEDTLAYQKGRG